MTAHARVTGVDAGALDVARDMPEPIERARVVTLYTLFFFGVLPTLLWTLGGRLDILAWLSPIESAPLRVAGAALALAGAAFMAWSMLSLSVRGKGLPITHLPPSSLVVRGPHAWMRHPIYVGYAALFGGAALAAGSIGRSLFATSLLVFGSVVYAVAFEEPRLRARFGEAYAAYVSAVPSFPFARAFASLARAFWSLARPSLERLANRVVLFRLGPAIVVTYGAFGAVGAGLALSIVHLLAGRALGARGEVFYIVGLALWMLAWARLVALLYQARLLFTAPREALRRVGFVSWGGYVGLFSFPFAFAHVASQPAWWLMDRTFLAALACSCLGRMGCLTYGCCYGRRSEHGLSWTDPDAKPVREGHEHASAPRVATQPSAGLHVDALIPMVTLVLQRSTPGTATAVGALLYVAARFAVECLRDEPRFSRLALTRGQVACAIGGTGAIAVLFALSPSTALQQAAAVTTVAGVTSNANAWAAIAAASLATFLVCGVHWRRVGRW